MINQAIILAGGSGKRVAPLSMIKPKSMFEIMGKPLIRHVLENLQRTSVGIEEVVVVIGPNESLIRDYLLDQSWLQFRLQFAIQEQPLGQANALLTARNHVRGHFFVLNANDIFDSSILAALAGLVNNETHVGLVGLRVPEPYQYGVMAFDNTSNKLVGVVEKPPKGTQPSDMAVVGLYCFSEQIWQAIDDTANSEQDDQFERAYNRLIQTGHGNYVKYEGEFASYKYPWHLLSINDILLKKIRDPIIDPSASISPAAILDGPVIIGPNVRIMEHAVIRGPAYIGSNTIVGNSTLLRGNVSIGHHSVIGYGTEISHSILGNNCWTHKNFIGDSIVSDGCSLGAGTITANVRFDEHPVKVRTGEKRISTGNDHFGMIMAENCRTGCNAVILPGKKIGPNSVVGPGVVLDDDLPMGKSALLPARNFHVTDNPLDLATVSRDERLRNLRH